MRDLVQGSVPRHVVALAVPTAAALGLQSIYALVDLAWVAGLGTAAVAGLGIGLQTFFFVFALGQILGTTTLAEVSQHVGGGRIDRAKEALSNACTAGVVLGLIGAVFVWVFAQPLVGLFSNDPTVVEQATAYVHATAATFVTQTLLLILGNAFRAAGDAITPLFVLALTVILNIMLDPLCIYTLGLGVAGAGWATVATQMVGLGVYVGRLGRRSELGIVRPQITTVFVRMVLTRGLPAGLQFALFGASLAVLLVAVRPEGVVWTAAVGSGFRILQQGLLPLFAVGSAAGAVAGQSEGAGDVRRVSSAWAVGLGLALSVSLVLVAGLNLGAELLGRWFSSEAASEAAVFLRWTSSSLVGFASALVATIVLQTLRRPLWPMATACLRFLVLSVASLWLIPARGLGPTAVFAVFTLTVWLEGGLDLLLFVRGRRLAHVQGGNSKSNQVSC